MMRFAFTLILFFTLHVPAFAQSDALPDNHLLPSYPSSQSSAQSEASDEFDEIKDEYIEEAQQFYEQCQTDYIFQQYYDCECLSMKYLDKRVEMGPERDSRTIVLHIRDTCHDATIAAGEMYGSCMTNGTAFPAGQDPVEHCECLANTYAKLFEESGLVPSSKAYKWLRARARGMCREQTNK